MAPSNLQQLPRVPPQHCSPGSARSAAEGSALEPRWPRLRLPSQLHPPSPCNLVAPPPSRGLAAHGAGAGATELTDRRAVVRVHAPGIAEPTTQSGPRPERRSLHEQHAREQAKAAKARGTSATRTHGHPSDRAAALLLLSDTYCVRNRTKVPLHVQARSGSAITRRLCGPPR